MQCVQCNQDIAENAPQSSFQCGHKMHTDCFMRYAYQNIHFFHNLECPEENCTEIITSPELAQEIETDNILNPNTTALQEKYETDSNFKEKIDGLKMIIKEFNRTKSKLGPVLTKKRKELIELTKPSIQILKASEKQYYDAFIQTEEYKAHQSALRKYKLHLTRISTLADTDTWNILRFIRTLGINFPRIVFRLRASRVRNKFRLVY